MGAVVLGGDGDVAERFYARCPIAGAIDPWVRDNVLPALGDAPDTHDSPRAMRDAFWTWLSAHKSGALVVADCGWPVEAGLLSACVADDPARAFAGPYPLHEVASLLFAAGLDPLATHGDEVLPGRSDEKHHPVYDAHVSALGARMALQRLAAPEPR